MNYFPLSIDLMGKPVFLVGNGSQIRAKAEKLAPFGPELVYKHGFTPEDAAQLPALVIVGDTEPEEARRISALCHSYRIPVNVVDMPQLCSFYFPGLILRGDLTVSLATGGKSPEAAAWLRRTLEARLPDRTEELLNWLHSRRQQLKRQGILKQAVEAAFSQNRPLTEAELEALARETAE